MYDYSEEITNYLLKQMSELQREAFEERLKWDKELAAEVTRQQEMLDTVHAIMNIKEAQEDPYYHEVDKLTTEILESQDKSGGKKQPRIKKKKGRRISLWLIPAAAVAVIVFIAENLLKLPLPDQVTEDARKRLGIRINISRNVGRGLGKGLAKIMSWFRKK